jgi:tetratricopeptide (TPR) repeat protein
MKVKPIYIYLGVFVIFVAALIYFSNTANKSNQAKAIDPNSQMPNDDVHKGMGTQKEEAPSKSNLREEALAKMESVKKEYEKNPNDTLKIREYADMMAPHKPNEAIPLYEKILKQDPKRKDILYQLTFMCSQMGALQQAEDYNNKILSMDKNDPIANYNLAGIYQAKGDTKKAKVIWQDIAKKYPNTDLGHMADGLVKQLDQATSKK